jgi:gluconate 5-dehydrogenase
MDAGAPSPTGECLADLQGKTALVTGGSRGPGFVVAQELIAAGVDAVAICGRNELILERARRDLARAGARVVAMRSDVADRRQVDTLVESVLARFGRLDVLVNGVGGGAVAAHEISGAFWAPLYVTLAVRPVMRLQGGGRIINIDASAPIAARAGGDANSRAQREFSRALRAELARDGIVVTTVRPETS